MIRSIRLGPILACLLPLSGVALAAKSLPPPSAAPVTHIVAVVNSDVISNTDVEDRARLFALSTGLPITQDVLDRLRQQITRQLVDERLLLPGGSAPQDRDRGQADRRGNS